LSAVERAGRRKDAALVYQFLCQLRPHLRHEAARQQPGSIDEIVAFCNYWIGAVAMHSSALARPHSIDWTYGETPDDFEGNDDLTTSQELPHSPTPVQPDTTPDAWQHSSYYCSPDDTSLCSQAYTYAAAEPFDSSPGATAQELAAMVQHELRLLHEKEEEIQ
jgi:hypothetical protein